MHTNMCWFVINLFYAFYIGFEIIEKHWTDISTASSQRKRGIGQVTQESTWLKCYMFIVSNQRFTTFQSAILFEQSSTCLEWNNSPIHARETKGMPGSQVEKSRWCAPVLFLTISIAVIWHQLYTIQTVSSYSHQNANNHYKRTKIAGVVLRKQSSLRIKMPPHSKVARIARGLPS